MTESIIFSGILEMLAFIILIMVEPLAAVPREYNRILLPGDIIQGWHQPGEYYHKYERRLIIRRNDLHSQYSNMKLFWPEQESTHTPRGKITFFKCTNQTPKTAKALMHLIRGGPGTPELLVDVMYTPLHFVFLNTMIITCDIYTDKSDIFTIKDPLMWYPFDTQENSAQIGATTAQTEIEISTLHAATVIPTPSSSGMINVKETTYSVDMMPMSQITMSSQENSQGTSTKSFTQDIPNLKNSTKELSELGITSKADMALLHSNPTNGRTDATTVHAKETTVKIESKVTPVDEMGQEINRTTSITHLLSLVNKNTSRGKTTESVNSSKIIKSSSQTDVTSSMIDKMTLQLSNETAGREQNIEMQGGGTSLATSTTSLHTNKTGPKMSSKNLKDVRTSTSSYSKEKTGLQTIKPTSEVTNPVTTKVTLWKSSISLAADKVSSNTEAQSFKTERTITIPYGGTSLGNNNSSLDHNGTSDRKKPNGKNSKVKKIEIGSSNENTSPRGEETTMEVTSSETIDSNSQWSIKDKSSITEETNEILCGKISLETNNTSTGDPQDQKDENSMTEETIEKPTTSAMYNIIIKFVPAGAQRKIGLAKITYQ